MKKAKPRTSKLLKPEPETYIVITKIDAARRQLETGIALWFHDKDPVSIHTLVYAAQDIMLPFAKEKGTFQGVLDTKFIKPETVEEFERWMRVHQNFFKHSSKDQHESIKFNPEADDGAIHSVTQMYREITGETTPIMLAYAIRFGLTNPDLYKADPFPQLSAEAKRDAVTMTKSRFLDIYMKARRAMQ